MPDAQTETDRTPVNRAVRSSARVAQRLVLVLAAYVLMAAPTVARAQQSEGIHAGVCRNAFGCAVQDLTECSDFVDCFGSALEAALFAAALAALIALVWEIALPAAAAVAME